MLEVIISILAINDADINTSFDSLNRGIINFKDDKGISKKIASKTNLEHVKKRSN